MRIACLLLALPLLAACDRPSVLVVGLDGADWDVMDPLMRAGHLPSMRRIVRGGVRGEVDCVPALPAFPCYCPPVWMSLMTGRSYAEHGIAHGGQFPGERDAKAIWSVLRTFGGTSTALTMHNTAPPDPDLDYALTTPSMGFAASRIFRVWPGGEAPGPSPDPPATGPPGLFEALGLLPHAGERVPVWGAIARDRVAMEALLRLVSVDRTDLTVVLLHATDKVEHVLWGWVQPEPGGAIREDVLLANADAWDGPVTGPAPLSWGTIPAQYMEVDRWLGELLSRFHFDYVVFVSDHGMTRNPLAGLPGHHGIGLHEAHRGILAIHGRGVRRGRDVGTVDLRDFAPTVAYLLDLPVAEDLPGRVIEQAFLPSRLRRRPIRSVGSWEELGVEATPPRSRRGARR